MNLLQFATKKAAWSMLVVGVLRIIHSENRHNLNYTHSVKKKLGIKKHPTGMS